MRDTSAGPTARGRVRACARSSIHTMPNGDPLLFRLDMDVTRPRGNPGSKQFVDEQGDRGRRLLGRRWRRAFVGVVEMLHFKQALVVARNGVAAIHLIDPPADVFAVRHGQAHTTSGGERQRTLTVDIERICCRDDKLLLRRGQGNDVKTARPTLRHQSDCLAGRGRQVGERKTKPRRECADDNRQRAGRAAE